MSTQTPQSAMPAPPASLGSIIPAPAPMDLKGNVAANWRYFRASWNNFATALGLSKKPKLVQVATRKCVMGKDCYLVYEHLPLTSAQAADPETVLDALGAHFEPKTNPIYERYIFNGSKQEAGESMDTFLAKLRKLAASCEYGVMQEELIRDRLVIGIINNQIRARLLREPYLTLQKATDVCRSSEQADMQIQQMEPAETAHYARARGRQQHQQHTKRKGKDAQAASTKCDYCGKTHDARKCPAYGTTCRKCQKRNHYAEVCKSVPKPSTTGRRTSGRQQEAAQSA